MPSPTRSRDVRKRLIDAPSLWSPAEICSRPSPAPRGPGIYSWFLEQVPPEVPQEGCVRHGSATLLYLGVAPSRPDSRSNVRKRLRSHLRGNASGSTLRLSLGCLLAEDLRIQLRRVGRTQRLTFSEGESRLSAWLDENALIAWVEIAAPWRFEKELIGAVSLPLNLDLNQAHPFHERLHAVRREARAAARKLPVLSR